VENEGFTYDVDDIANIRALRAAVSSGDESKEAGMDAVSDWPID